MVEVSVEERHGAVTVGFEVIAGSIERAIEADGEVARMLFPMDPERFFLRASRGGRPARPAGMPKSSGP